MAGRRASSRAADEPAEVTLVGPNGDEITTSHAMSVNNLIYGMGYRPKSGTTDEAVQSVQVDEPDATGEA